MIDTGSGLDSVLLGSADDSLTLTGALTSTSLTSGGGADSIVVKANVSSGYFDISGTGGTSDSLIFQSVGAVGTTVKGGTDGDLVSLYGANDLVLNIFSGDTLMGGTGADTLLFTGTVMNSSISAGSGADSLYMSGTDMSGNTIDLGIGTDTLVFTENSENDMVTVAGTTISSSNAKNITYQKSATSAAITTAAGADVVVFQDLATGLAAISTNSGNDSIQFLKLLTSLVWWIRVMVPTRSTPPTCFLEKAALVVVPVLTPSWSAP